MSDYISKWHKELGIFSKIKPLVILEGNVLDSYQYPVEGSTPKGSILRLPEYLHFFFKDMGYKNIAFYDSLSGFYNTGEEGYIENFAKLVECPLANGSIRADFKGGRNDSATAIARKAVSQSNESTVIVMNFASRYITSSESMDQCEVDSFTVLLKASLEAKEVRAENGSILKNLIVLVVNKVNDIPAWFYLQNPNVKLITLRPPTKEEREALVKGPNFPSFFLPEVYSQDAAYYSEHPDELDKIRDKFVAITDGFSFTEINGLRRLCKNERIRISNFCDVVDLYKYGIRENPWKNLDLSRICDAKSIFEKRVKGQDYALAKTLDVIKRAVTGMSGLQGSSPTRPKGVLFFAGPTGTGKTETAKTLAQLVFGDESCCTRFDMSEYSQSHSDQRLLGAPPGYIGYEAGGQLTNAVKRNPFSILLFDEIEKAHPSILDKFLQILEDGRMTDSHGDTVYFTETIIIFTSNLGIYTRDDNGKLELNVKPDMSYSEMSVRVREAVEDHFKLTLGRPEILNRIGDNIVIFDFIRPEIAKSILFAKVESVIASVLSEKHISVTISDEAKEILTTEALKNLTNGGRGVGNVVESLLINPLARYICDNKIPDNTSIIIDSINLDAGQPELVCRRG